MRINFKKLSYVLMALVIAMTLVVSMGNVFAGDKVKGEFSKYKLGVKGKEAEKKAGIQTIDLQNLNGKSKAGTAADHSAEMPPVGNQGGQGSCTGWSSSYLMGFQKASEMGWGNQMFSPAFIYNQINGGVDEGAYTSDAVELMYNIGAVRLPVMPYFDSNWTTQPDAVQLNIAENYKASNWGYIEDTPENLKLWLTNDCFVTSIAVYDDFYDTQEPGHYYDSTNGTLWGYHSICIVGYDDSKNAYKFINSWGTSYGVNGYGWITYDVMSAISGNKYGMIAGDSEPITIKNRITFKDARIVAKGNSSGAGNQWSFACKNETKSTMIKYYRGNDANPVISADASFVSTWDGCYLGVHEWDTPSSKDDYANKTISKLALGDNTIYLTCRDYDLSSSYWSKWRFIVNRIEVELR